MAFKSLFGNSQKSRCIISAISLVIILLITILLVLFAGEPVKISSVIPSGVDVLRLESSETITQEIVSSDMVLTDICITFGTYMRENQGTLRVNFYENDKIIETWETRASELLDNTPSSFPLTSPLHMDVESNYQFDVTYIYEGDANAIALWMSENDEHIDCYNGEEIINMDVSHGILYQNIQLTAFKKIVYLFLACSVVACIYMLWLAEIEKEKFFQLTVVILGIAFMLVITPHSAPDEEYHYRCAYKYSNYFVGQWENVYEWDKSAYNYSGYNPHHNVSSGYIRLVEDLGDRSLQEGVVELPGTYTSVFFPLYIAQGLGIAVARVFNGNFIITYYMGRLFNLLFYSLCVYLAVKRTPKFKLLLGLVSLVPMALQQAASYSYDAFINGISLVLIASILKAIYEEGQLSMKDYLWILVSGMLLCPTKIVYFVILFLTFAIPVQRFGNIRKKIIGVSMIILMGLMLIGMSGFAESVTEITSSVRETNWEGEYDYTIGFVFTEPIETIRIFLNTLKVEGIDWALCSIGYFLSAQSLSVSKMISISFILILFFAAAQSRNGTEIVSLRTINIWERTLFLIIPCAVLVLVMLSMFLAWTSNTSNVIQGIQGRYFIPIIPLVFMATNNRFLSLERYWEKHLMLAAVVLNMITIIQVIAYTMAH